MDRCFLRSRRRAVSIFRSWWSSLVVIARCTLRCSNRIWLWVPSVNGLTGKLKLKSVCVMACLHSFLEMSDKVHGAFFPGMSVEENGHGFFRRRESLYQIVEFGNGHLNVSLTSHASRQTSTLTTIQIPMQTGCMLFLPLHLAVQKLTAVKTALMVSELESNQSSGFVLVAWASLFATVHDGLRFPFRIWLMKASLTLIFWANFRWSFRSMIPL